MASSPTKIYFCTSNEHKRREVERILNLDPATFEVSSVDVEIPELQGEPEEIVMAKCKAAYGILKHQGRLGREDLVLVEDTNLEFDALHGLPGPYIRHFLQKLGHDGLVKLVAGFDTDAARATDYVAIWDGEESEEPKWFKGETLGRIVAPQGSNRSFGWDCCFYATDISKTYAEATPAEKDSISHRRRALTQLAAYLLQERSHA